MVSCPADKADEMARTLVAERIAACVNTLPAIQSTYRWQGEVTSDSESLLLIKTVANRFETLQARVLALHPYELPEIIAVDLVRGHEPYLKWIAESVSNA